MRLRTLRHWIIALTPSLLGSGQHLSVQVPRETVGNPTSKPLQRRFVGVDPMMLYRGLLSSSPKERTQAFQQLRHQVTDASLPADARLYALNLDSDDDLEYVLIVTVSPAATLAFVFDKSAQGWCVVGEFSYGWHWDANEAERLIEFREIAWYGRKEIIVRERGGGAGVTETALSIYRMHNGYLYRVFHTTEDAFHYVYGAGRTEYEHRTIEYRDADADGHVFLVVHYDKRIEPDQHSRPLPEVRSCSAFRWNAGSFVFVEDTTAAPKVCTGRVNR
jgi:hypothetical protein